MLPLLRDLIITNPFVEEIEFADKGILQLDHHSVDLLGRFTELRKVTKFGNSCTLMYLTTK